ncbi:MAG: hypothetical protein V4662_13870 [Verrucomicrobiota bacterium]
MNATAEQLDHYLREADPATARTVEQIVGLVMQRFQPAKGGQQPGRGGYRIKTQHMGAFQPGFDPHKLGQLPEDF